MNPGLEAAIEQLRWQFEHSSSRDVPHGACCAMGKDLEGVEPAVLILFAWGDAAAFFIGMFRQHGFEADGEGIRMFPPKPNLN